LNNKLIPESLHQLIPLVEKWGIEDDGYRDELVENSTIEELEKLVNSISEEEADILNEWFCDPESLNDPSTEYIKFSVFFMAFEYANQILKNNKA